MIRSLFENYLTKKKLKSAELKGANLLGNLAKGIDPAHPFNRYESAVTPKRHEVQKRLFKVMNEKDPKTFLKLVIYYAAGGFHITKPVDRWIRTAGERCIEEGHQTLGEKLIKHAAHEAGHEKMHAEDLSLVVKFCNELYGTNFDAKKLLNLPFTEGIRQYIDLHEQTITSALAYGQIAIEYEIERLSVSAGPIFLKACFEHFGLKLLRKLQFITEHAQLDHGHTVYNRDLLKEFILSHPSTTDHLINFGSAALESFTRYIEDAHKLAQS